LVPLGRAHGDNEPGTEVYVMHTDDKDPNVVWFYEIYRDDEAFGVHGNSDMMKEFGKVFGALAAGRPELIRLTPVVGKGVSL
jgi:quinol monooxygenase YgiN